MDAEHNVFSSFDAVGAEIRVPEKIMASLMVLVVAQQVEKYFLT